MKLLALSLLLVGTSHAFVSQTQTPKSATAVKAQKNDWFFGPAAVTLAGWAIAAQISFATPLATELPGESDCSKLVPFYNKLTLV
jgi:hypothetical protein